MGEFWDQRARENSLYFINNSLSYRETDPDAFWASGPNDVDAVLGALGVEIEPDDDIVEIGCGVGRMTRPMAERGRSVRALDVSAEMLQQARAENPQLDNVEWIHGNGTELNGIDVLRPARPEGVRIGLAIGERVVDEVERVLAGTLIPELAHLP